MKRTILFLGTVLTLASTSRAQLFLEAHGTYLLPVGGLSMNSYDDLTNSGTATSSLFNAGQGYGGGLVLGGALSGTLGWEARFTYISGKEHEMTYRSTSSNDVITLRSRYVRIEPALRFTSGGTGTRVYLAAGPSLAFVPRLVTEEKDVYSSGVPFGFTSNQMREEEFTGGIGLGGFGALGVLFGSGPVNFFLELQCTAQTWAPKECEWSSSETITNGTDSSTETDSGTIEYVTELSSNDNDKELRLRLPMSSWGFRGGLRFTLGS